MVFEAMEVSQAPKGGKKGTKKKRNSKEANISKVN